MKSELHQKLQDKALNYLLSKTYWVRAEEVPTPGGIVDAWGISRASNFETACIEIKVSRSDFKSQSQKYKEIDSHYLANCCYILCPEGLIGSEEVCENWGLLWYRDDRIINKKQAKFLEMTDRQKLEIMICFLDSGINIHRPKVPKNN